MQRMTSPFMQQHVEAPFLRLSQEFSPREDDSFLEAFSPATARMGVDLEEVCADNVCVCHVLDVYV